MVIGMMPKKNALVSMLDYCITKPSFKHLSVLMLLKFWQFWPNIRPWPFKSRYVKYTLFKYDC